MRTFDMELGNIEASWFFKANELVSFIANIDSEGNNYFDRLDESIAESKKMRSRSLESVRISNLQSFINIEKLSVFCN